jgi:hypothetical protein
MTPDEKILNLDLECVSYKLHIEKGWSIDKIDMIENEYKAFLSLAGESSKYNFRIVPSKDIDEFWHQHILDTEKYIKDCIDIFGRVIHHFPYSGLLGDDDIEFQKYSYQQTKIMIEKIKFN